MSTHVGIAQWQSAGDELRRSAVQFGLPAYKEETMTYKRVEPGVPIGTTRTAVFGVRETDAEVFIVRWHAESHVGDREPAIIASFTPMEFSGQVEASGSFAALVEECSLCLDWDNSLAAFERRRPRVPGSELLTRWRSIYGQAI